MVCDECRKHARGLARCLLEGAGVCGAIGAVGGKRRLRSGQSPPLELGQRRAGSGGERHRARVRAPLTCQAARAGIERRAACGDPRAAARARGQFRGEARDDKVRAECERLLKELGPS